MRLVSNPTAGLKTCIGKIGKLVFFSVDSDENGLGKKKINVHKNGEKNTEQQRGVLRSLLMTKSAFSFPFFFFFSFFFVLPKPHAPAGPWCAASVPWCA
jgi:hypothetical protein